MKKSIITETIREPKSSETARDTVLSVRLPYKLAAQVKEAASAEGTSVSDWIRSVIENASEGGYLEERPKKEENKWETDLIGRLSRSLEGILNGWGKAKLEPMIQKAVDEGLPF